MAAQASSPDSEGARLVFVQHLGTEDGFASSEIETLNDEIVIRELVQNALDAKPHGVVRVDFVTQLLRVDDLPGIEDYRSAFGKIPQRLREGTRAARISQRIEEVLAGEYVTCLICRDNGIGLDEDGYKKLLNKGAGGKTEADSSARGSVGVGHLTAIAASGLRYALYGSVGADGAKMLGGQCFLATHEDVDDAGLLIHRSHHGCVTADRHAGSFKGTEPKPDDAPPSWLVGDIELGTAVCIAAYERPTRAMKRAATHDPLGAMIAEIVAHHFTVAIESHLMVVTHTDARSGASTTVGGSTEEGKDGFRAAIERIKDRKRAAVAGLGAGRNAHAAWHTWRDGRSLEPTHPLLEGAEIRLRETPGDRTRVTMFREGMRISDEVGGLEASDFADRVAFNAVIDATGVFGRLVRACETSSHLQVEPAKAEKEKSEQLKEALRALAEELRLAVDLKDTDRWEPESLRLLRGELDERSPRKQAKPAPPPVDMRTDADEEGRPLVDDPQPRGGDTAGDTSKSRVQSQVKGKVTGLAASAIPQTDDQLRVIWRADLDGDHPQLDLPTDHQATVAVRLLAGNGSDPACERQVGAEAIGCRVVGSSGDYAPSIELRADRETVTLEIATEDIDREVLAALRVEVHLLQPEEALL